MQAATVSCTRWEMLQMLVEKIAKALSVVPARDTFQQAFDGAFKSHWCCVSMFLGSSKVIKICILPYLKTKQSKNNLKRKH